MKSVGWMTYGYCVAYNAGFLPLAASVVVVFTCKLLFCCISNVVVVYLHDIVQLQCKS